MTLGKRVRTYLVGFAMGLIMVYFLFGDRMGDWMPESRIKQRLSIYPMSMKPKTKCLIDCHLINDSIILETLISGEVLMSESQPRNKPNPIYTVEAQDKSFKVKFEAVDTTKTELLDFIPKEMKECDC